MGGARPALGIALFVATAALGRADVLWDNFPSGFDTSSYLSSERYTEVLASWTADDAIFETDVTVQGIEWVGLRDPDYDYPQAEMIVLSPSPDPFNPGSYVLTPVGSVMSLSYDVVEVFGTQPDFDGRTLEIYRAVAMLGGGPKAGVGGLDLEAGHYFFGIRLVGLETVSLGRAYLASSQDLLGMDSGYFQSMDFGIADFMPVDQLPQPGAPTDYAIRILGVPEPSTIVLLGAGLAAAGLRRRAGAR